MKWILSLDEIDSSVEAGGKARALAALNRKGIRVPDALCIPAPAYRFFVGYTGLDQIISLELGKKGFANMRWEELWDISLRLRNGFAKARIPDELSLAIEEAVTRQFKGLAVSVRSSALAEDSAQTSFAGLHDTFVNLTDVKNIVKHVKLVWASLWTDRALMYRRELGLDPFESAMAVVIQHMIMGESSGVVFSMNPLDHSRASIEAVYGLNQGLVDGSIQPDHWELDRTSGNIMDYQPAERQQALRPGLEGVTARDLSSKEQQQPPLNSFKVVEIYKISRRLEEAFQAPQDVEWTITPPDTYILQSRNITALNRIDEDDERLHYLDLKRSLKNLKALRLTIEQEIIPGMEREYGKLSFQNLDRMTDVELAKEIERRQKIVSQWVEIYWRDCIPFAHGMRLFGQVYNDRLVPQDPYEFMDLLSGAELESTNRNQLLRNLGDTILSNPDLAKAINRKADLSSYKSFVARVDDFITLYGAVSWGGAHVSLNQAMVVDLAAKFATKSISESEVQPQSSQRLEEVYLSTFSPSQQQQAGELLEIGRASYRLRDDDNIYLGKLEGESARAAKIGRDRLDAIWGPIQGEIQIEELIKCLVNTEPPQVNTEPVDEKRPGPLLPNKARQLLGQPASKGLASGLARVVASSEDLFDFQTGEILICDAIDPNMTFIAPLAAAIVERRGGMLIHGAIIAREHSIPCVTGVPEATTLIETGEFVSVDGYLGIVTVGNNSLRAG